MFSRATRQRQAWQIQGRLSAQLEFEAKRNKHLPTPVRCWLAQGALPLALPLSKPFSDWRRLAGSLFSCDGMSAIENFTAQGGQEQIAGTPPSEKTRTSSPAPETVRLLFAGAACGVLLAAFDFLARVGRASPSPKRSAGRS